MQLKLNLVAVFRSLICNEGEFGGSQGASRCAVCDTGTYSAV